MSWYHPSPLAVLLDALAAYRLTRLVTADVITARPRHAVIRWAYRRRLDRELLDGDLEGMVEADMAEGPDVAPKLAVLVVCRWCTAVWVAGGVVAARCLTGQVWGTVAAVLAVAAAATLLAGLEQG